MFVSKRVLIIVGVVVVVVMLAAGVGLVYAFSALGQQSSANASLSATATARVSPTPGGAPGQRRVAGVVKSLGNQSFVLAVDKGKRSITVNVNAQTKYTSGGAAKAASFSNLQVGETVAVQGTYDAASKTMTAARVVIAPKTKTATPTPAASPTATATP